MDQAAIGDVWKSHEGEIAELRRLRNFVMDATSPWQGRTIQKSDPHDLTADEIVAMELSRTLTSAWVCADLIAMGFADQAMMICRSMFEGMVVANWVHLNPDQAPERFLEAGTLNDHLEIRMAISNGWISAGEVQAGRLLDPDDLEGLQKKFGRYGEKMWTDPNDLRRLSDKISEGWEEDRRDALLKFRSAALRSHNQTLHATPESLLSKVSEVSVEGLALSIGPAHRGGPGIVAASMALQSAWWTLAEMARLVAIHFGLDIEDELEELIVGGAFVYLPIYDDEARGVGRNDACPCGSGRKFKRCHLGRTRRRMGSKPR
ncbi:MAG TPA: SEC-C metal-binding domain-containing protein [Solirubrobacterales bacterium]|nr:SEC-C metal-binding domain-containing protein [Solirubrobacterales bacterium]